MELLWVLRIDRIEMTKERQKQLVTLVVLALAAGLALAGKSGWRFPYLRRPGPAASIPTQEPQEAIYAMLEAARRGDVPAYLACYTGQMLSALEASVAESAAEGFARYLRDSNAAIKGVAVREPELLSGTEAKLRVEYVYQDRNEAQTVYLEKVAGRWKIARIDSAERIKTLVPYGTPVR